MASSTRIDYRNSDEQRTKKIAAAPASIWVRRAYASSLSANQVRTLEAFLVVCKGGPDLWAGTKKVAIQAGFCYRTVQRHIDELEDRKVLKLKHLDNVTLPVVGFRSSRTYVMHPEAANSLKPRRTYLEWKNNPPDAATQRRPKSIHSRSSEPAPTAQEATTPAPQTAAAAPATPATPIPQSPLEKSHRQILGGNRGVRETRKELRKLVDEFMRPQNKAGPRIAVQCELQLARSSIAPKLNVAPDPWAEVVNSFRKRVDPHTFETWLKPSRFLRAEDKTMVVAIPSREFAHIGEKFSSLLQAAVMDLCLGYERIVFEWMEVEQIPGLDFDAALRKAAQQNMTPLKTAQELLLGDGSETEDRRE